MSGRAKMGNKGFTLVEVMLSIAILALISVPLMKYFSDSLKYATQTAEKQKAVLIAQETVEYIKSQKKIVKPVTTTATATPATTGTPDPDATLPPANNYVLAPELVYRFGGYVTPAPSGTPENAPQIIVPDKFYASGATLDGAGGASPLVYRYVDQKSGKYYIEVSMNCITPADQVSSPAIMNIDDSRNVVIPERTEVMDAITHFSTLNINQYLSWNGGYMEDPNMSPTPTPDEFIYITVAPDDPGDLPVVAEYKQLSEAEIRENMNRIIYITISKGNDDATFKVSAYYQFFCKDVFGPGTDSDMEYPSASLCEANVENLDGIFLMFNKLSSTRDYIQVIWEVTDPNIPYPDFRFVVQDDVVTEEDLADSDDEDDEDDEDEVIPETTITPVDPSAYNLRVYWHNFTSDEYVPSVHSNLPADNFTFVGNVDDPITEPEETIAEGALREDIPVTTLTGSGVPVRIFDITVKVYANKKAYENEPDNPLVELKTTKVE